MSAAFYGRLLHSVSWRSVNSPAQSCQAPEPQAFLYAFDLLELLYVKEGENYHQVELSQDELCDVIASYEAHIRRLKTITHTC